MSYLRPTERRRARRTSRDAAVCQPVHVIADKRDLRLAADLGRDLPLVIRLHQPEQRRPESMHSLAGEIVERDDPVLDDRLLGLRRQLTRTQRQLDGRRAALLATTDERLGSGPSAVDAHRLPARQTVCVHVLVLDDERGRPGREVVDADHA